MTRLQLCVLTALLNASSANGHDFGILDDELIEEARNCGEFSAQQVGGQITAFSKAGKIQIHDPVEIDNAPVVQFTIENL